MIVTFISIYSSFFCIRKQKFPKKRNIYASNEYTDSELQLFVDKISEIDPFPKIRDLKNIFYPHLTLAKINAILKYLERSRLIIVDLDGNIVWIKQKNVKEEDDLSSVANFSEDFKNYLKKYNK